MMLRWFSAKYKGECNACGKKFEVGAQIAFMATEESSEDVLVAEWCCGGSGFEVLQPLMPRGKTKEDVCPDCFIIHATNQTECYE